MLEVILLWGYLLFVHVGIGAGALKLLYLAVGKKEKPVELMPAVMAGVVAICAYAGFFSIFYKVGMAAHLLLLGLVLLSVWFCKEELLALWRHCFRTGRSWEGALYAVLLLVLAFFASRGEMHTDTGIYHAQAIRWYEEYGLVKGLGNLQQHFAYNSASLGYAAVFSMKWLLGRSLHVTNGFLQAVLCIWALRGLREFKGHESNLADAGRVGILMYTLVCLERIMSPATDYAAMYLSLYIIVRWAQLCSEKRREADTEDYALLCVAAVCVASFKLSAGMLILLALYPAVLLICRKQGRQLLLWAGVGLAVLLPFLIRNVLISGWLIYPFDSLDLFEVDWKVPGEWLRHDADQIRAWGRCLDDAAQADAPLAKWLPVWWQAKSAYEKMLLMANLAALIPGTLAFLSDLWRGKKPDLPVLTLQLAVLGSVLGWFLTAPFIRYGLAFLLEFPLLSLGIWLRRGANGPAKIMAGLCGAVCVMLLCYYWSYYGVYDMRWSRQHLKDPAYIRQQDYDVAEVDSLLVGDFTVYYPREGETISYHAFPGVAYAYMADRCEPRGASLRDGFRAK